MSEDTEKFCRDFGPFTPVQRFAKQWPLQLAGYAVRSRIGEDVAFTDTPDQARAIAEALNLTAENAKSAEIRKGMAVADPHFWDKQ